MGGRELVAGGFRAGLKPTGNKDPFALRRAALGLARTLVEGRIDLDLDLALSRAGGDVAELRDFILDRLRSYYAEQSVPVQQFEAVAAVQPRSLADFGRRLAAIAEFARLPEAAALAAANKRIRNILRKVEGGIPDAVDPALFTEPAERELAAAVDAAIADTDAGMRERDYVAVLGRLARLRPQVDAFFDGVMVNVDDPAVRNNRLALLQRLGDRLGSVAAIEHLSS